MSQAEPGERDQLEPATGRRVVVLCTEPRLGQLLAYWLAPATKDLVMAADGHQASALLSDPDRTTVLITDRVVPPWPGLPPLPALKQANPRLRVIVVHDRAGGLAGSSGALASGIDENLPRPLSRAAVLRSIAPA